MTISAHCPSCGKSAAMPDGAAGKQAKCHHCQTVFTIPCPTTHEGDGKHRTWVVRGGDAAKRMAQDLGARFDAHRPLVTLASNSPAPEVVVKGYIDCHGCFTRIPFKMLVQWGVPLADALQVCPSCGNQVQMHHSQHTRGPTHILLLETAPQTGHAGESNRPNLLTVEHVQNVSGR